MNNADMEIKYYTDTERPGVQRMTIEALDEQGAIDLEMELPRILKLLERDWQKAEE